MNMIRPMLFSYLLSNSDLKKREGLSQRREKTVALIKMDNPIDRWPE
jgi:hypothetical protein